MRAGNHTKGRAHRGLLTGLRGTDTQMNATVQRLADAQLDAIAHYVAQQ